MPRKTTFAFWSLATLFGNHAEALGLGNFLPTWGQPESCTLTAIIESNKKSPGEPVIAIAQAIPLPCRSIDFPWKLAPFTWATFLNCGIGTNGDNLKLAIGKAESKQEIRYTSINNEGEKCEGSVHLVAGQQDFGCEDDRAPTFPGPVRHVTTVRMASLADVSLISRRQAESQKLHKGDDPNTCQLPKYPELRPGT